MRITMAGTGYVGLVTGACFANAGNDVVCLDTNAEKIRILRGGGCPIYEPGLPELLEKNIAAGRLTFSEDPREAYRDAEVIFVGVGTPPLPDGGSDLRYVFAVADDVAKTINELGPGADPKVVVVKSTVPVGTTLAVKERIRNQVGDLPFHVANNPEFLKEGAAVGDFQKPDRVVCGIEDESVGEVMHDLYEPFVRQGNPILLMDILSSEMVKYASNNFLATKISYINEMANLCERYGANINRVREGMSCDVRIGKHFLYPGLGYGGSCFPKDTLACISMGEQSGFEMQLSRSVHEVNQRQRRHFFDKILNHFGGPENLRGKTLGFWGVAFKPHTDDVREAPAFTLIDLALEHGMTVRAFDPVAAANAKEHYGDRISTTGTIWDAVENADALVICTEWEEFRSPDFDKLKRLLPSRVIFDGRNLYRLELMEREGFTYYSVGRPTVNEGPAAPQPAVVSSTA